MERQRAKDALSDGDLLQFASQGDEEAFLKLYRRHQGPVFRFALHMSGMLDTAEEVTQEVFLHLLRSAREYSAERGTLEAYLIGIARNKVRHHLQQDRRLSNGISEVGRSRRDSSGEELLAALSREQELAALRVAILNLPPKYREVVVLCCLEGLDYEETAGRLECAVGTVRSRLSRAKTILGAKLRRQESCML